MRKKTGLVAGKDLGPGGNTSLGLNLVYHRIDVQAF